MGTLKRIFDFLMSPPQPHGGEAASTAGKVPARRRLSVMNLRRQDVVTYEGVDYLVENVLVYDDSGFHWRAYHLVDTVSGNKLWLSAEEDDTLEVGIFRPIELELEGNVPESLTWEGETFHQEEHGHAQVMLEGPTEIKQALAEYWDFESSSGKMLSVERWSSETEVSVGHSIEPFKLTLLPGDEVSP